MPIRILQLSSLRTSSDCDLFKQDDSHWPDEDLSWNRMIKWLPTAGRRHRPPGVPRMNFKSSRTVDAGHTLRRCASRPPRTTIIRNRTEARVNPRVLVITRSIRPRRRLRLGDDYCNTTNRWRNELCTSFQSIW